MKFFKKLSGVVLAGILCVPLCAVFPENLVSAENSGDFAYQVRSDQTAEIICQNPDIVRAEIPAEIDGHPVTALAENCFAQCDSMIEVIIPDTVTKLGDYAFFGCSSLTEIAIPASVTAIGDYVFDTTERLTKFEVDPENPSYQSPDGVLYDKAGGTLLKYPESRPEQSYTVLDSCQNIADWAFVGSVYLESIDLQQVRTIGEDAFYYCIALKEITIPEGVTELPGAVFGCCAELETVNLPSGLLSIGNKCFYSCVSLQKINLPEGLQKMGEYAFCHCTELRALAIPESLTTVNTKCMGYLYDEESNDYTLQENITLYVYPDSAAWKYAATNHIPFEFIRNYDQLYLILIIVILVIILILSFAIFKILKGRREA
ncbi:MAG: leucine-rich repeat domain-containing protein [Oscillospiraceae bacterium]|nr:leucine-rich repeat domain-containing protein [Oscillospiraceae bacterium]